VNAKRLPGVRHHPEAYLKAARWKTQIGDGETCTADVRKTLTVILMGASGDLKDLAPNVRARLNRKSL